MERLTKIDSQGRLLAYSLSDTGLPTIIVKNNPYYDLLMQLNAYENTNMSPEDVNLLKSNFEAKSLTPEKEKQLADIYTIKYCPFCGEEKLEYDDEYGLVVCNECGRNFRIEENLY